MNLDGFPTRNVVVGHDGQFSTPWKQALDQLFKVSQNAAKLGTIPVAGTSTAVFVVNAGAAINAASTFDGYTLQQVVKAMRDAGLLP